MAHGKDPALPLYAMEWRTDMRVRMLDRGLRALLLDLWALFWTDGALPDDADGVAKLVDGTAEEIRHVLEEFFVLSDEGWTSPRFDARKPDDPVVYVISDREAGLLKIGTSRTLTRRLRTLQREHGDHLQCVGTFPGSYREEKVAHRTFADLHAHGEWFQDHPLIRQWLLRKQKEGC